MATAKDLWNNPKPLISNDKNIPEFPVDALGVILGEAAREIAEIVQAPVGVVAQSVLAAATLACQGHADVKVDGRRTPGSNYFMTVASSGERKSESNEIAMREIHRHEARLQCHFEDEMRAREELELRGREKSGRIHGRSARKRLGSKSAINAMPPVLVWKDASYDGIASSLADSYPSTGVFSDEGANFIGGYSMGAEQIGRTAAGLCSLWGGKLDPRLRKGSRHGGHRGCRFAMHLMIQPTVAKEFFAQPFLWEQGFFTRNLIIEAPGLAGTRQYRPGKVNKLRSVRTYHSRIRSLLRAPLPIKVGTKNELAPRVLVLTAQAKKRWIRFVNEVEGRLGKGGSYEHLPGVATRAPEHVLRLAIVLTLISDPTAKKIELTELKNARRLVIHYLSHARRIFDSINGNERIAAAQAVLDYLCQQGEERVTLQCIYQRGPKAVRLAREARAIMRLLEQHGWVKPQEVQGKDGYRVNRVLFEGD